MLHLKTMKTIIIHATAAFFVVSGFASAQVNQLNQEENKFEIVQGTYLGLSKPIRELPQEWDESKVVYSNDEHEVKENRKRPVDVDPTALPKDGKDPARQSFYSKTGYQLPMGVNFNGLGGAFPPDPTGAASETHYVQAVNTSYRVYLKDGSAVTGVLQLSSLWPGSTNSGDPIVMWDRHAERWVITQFQTGTNRILFAISQTSDPTGAYHGYQFSFPTFPDYPKYSIWPDGYYMTSNTNQRNVVAFQREKMLVGDPTAAMISLNLPSFATHYGFRSVLPADADGDLPPYGTPNYMFLFQDDAWSAGVTEDHIRVLKMEVDWDTPANSSITNFQNIPTLPFKSTFTTSWNDIQQKGTTQRIDAIASIFNYRAQYLRWPGYNTVMLCKVVDVNGSLKGGLRWYELRQDDVTGEFTIRQQSTYSPNDNDSRFIGSIAMDYNGHIGMGFSISGPDRHPSLAFTGRHHWDALNEMSLPETVAIEGTGSQTSGNRFGDYSHLALDPDGSTFWFTGEYLVSGGGRRTRIFSFNLQQVASVDEAATVKEPELLLNQDANNILVSGLNLQENDKLLVDLFEINGRQIGSQEVTVLGGEITASFSKGALSSGVYLVRIGKEGFQRVQKISVAK
jgi:hypothetical protein